MVVNDVCTASLIFIRSIAAKKEIEVSYTCDKPDATLHADPIRLKQMLINLLSNAVKFTPTGKRAPARERSPGRATDSISLWRIPASALPRATWTSSAQPFTQLDATLSRTYEGTGLGLALVKRLANQHGGDVR